MSKDNKNSFKLLEKTYMEEYKESSEKVESSINKSILRVEVISNITEVFLPKLFAAALHVFESSTKSIKKDKN